jgi:hypothetical protein
VFTNLILKGDVAAGASKQYTITLRVNGSNTALAAVYSGTNTTASSGQRVSVSAGDILTLSSVPSGTPAAVLFHGSIEFRPSNPNICIIMGGSGDVALGLAAGYLCPAALANRSAGEDQVWIPIPYARGGQFGTVSNLYVALDVAPGIGHGRKLTIYKNSVSTGEYVQIDGTSTSGNAGVTVDIDDGDTLSLYAEPVTSPAGSKIYYGMTIETQAVGDYIIAGVSGDAMSTSTTVYSYQYLSTGNAAWRTAKTERPNAMGAWRHFILGVALKLTRAPNATGGSGKAYELYLEHPSATGNKAYVGDGQTYDCSDLMCWGSKRFNTINVRSLGYGSPNVVDGAWALHMRYLG